MPTVPVALGQLGPTGTIASQPTRHMHGRVWKSGFWGDCKVGTTSQSKWGDLIQVRIMVEGSKRPSSHLIDDKCEYRSKSVTQGVRGQEDALWTWQGGVGWIPTPLDGSGGLRSWKCRHGVGVNDTVK